MIDIFIDRVELERLDFSTMDGEYSTMRYLEARNYFGITPHEESLLLREESVYRRMRREDFLAFFLPEETP